MTTPPDASGDVQRRDFLKAAGAGALALGALGTLGACASAGRPGAPPGLAAPRRKLPLVGASPDVVVVGAGSWGGWTALNLVQQGARVTLVDAFGPGNSRSTSGDESRGVRSSYGDRDVAAELWMLWARESIRRWKTFDAEWGNELGVDLFHTTGDLIFRAEWEPFTTRTRDLWQKHGVRYEILKPEEVRHRWPVIDIDGIGIVLGEPDAGVVRARRSCQAVTAVFERLGGRVVTGRAQMPTVSSGTLNEITLDTGETLRADTFVYAVGPWMGKTFPDVFENRTRAPMGYVYYFGTPVNDERFTHPNIPSFNFPGVTGWAALPVDNRGFRVRGGVRAPTPPNARGPVSGSPTAAPTNAAATRPPAPVTPPAQLDPDTSDRWPEATRIDGTRRFLAQRFPTLKDAPVLQTHACHYELTSSRNFIVDRHPRLSNVWLAGGGNAEGFKFGPVIGGYIAQRVLGREGDAEVDRLFRIPEKGYDPPPTVAAAAPPDTAKRSAR